MLRRIICVLAVTAVLVTGGTRNALAAFNFNFGLGTGDLNADVGFQLAADSLTGKFDDDVTVNITSGFGILAPGVLGSASSTQAFYSFSGWKSAMALDVSLTSAADAIMVAGLPAGTTYSKWMNRTTTNSGGSFLYLGADDVRLTNANAKALGLIAAHQGGQDAVITFSNQYTWDFDPSNGITAGAIDFVGVAMHELIHAMGFISGVDILDYNSAPLLSASAFDDYASGLDFTRHSADSLAAGADMDWTADTRAKDYSIDAGATTLIANAWSTGSNYGDGRQASHWKDHLGIGIMDPTAAPAGSQMFFMSNDRQALDVIGWDAVIPEPGSLAVWSILLTCMVVWRRRRSAG